MVKQQVFRSGSDNNGAIENGLAFKPFALRKEELGALQRKRTARKCWVITPEIEEIVKMITQIDNPVELRKYSLSRNAIVRAAVAFSPVAGTIREGLQSDDDDTVGFIASITPSKLRRIHDDMRSVGLSFMGALRKIKGATNQNELDLFFKELHTAAYDNIRNIRRSR